MEENKKKSDHKALPKRLLRVQKYYDLNESEKICHYGCVPFKIGEEKSEQLDIITAKIQGVEHIKLKYACKACEGNVKAARAPIAKSIASESIPSFV